MEASGGEGGCAAEGGVGEFGEVECCGGAAGCCCAEEHEGHSHGDVRCWWGRRCRIFISNSVPIMILLVDVCHAMLGRWSADDCCRSVASG